MKRRLFVFGLAAMMLASCGGAESSNTSTSSQTSSSQSSQTSQESSKTSSESTSTGEEKKDFTGVSFEGASYTYDGNAHEIAVVGAPDFATVTYDKANSYIDAGTYEITATVSAEGYNDFVKKATLTISKAEFKGLSFKDASFEYDGNPHSITITGNIPSTASVTYSSDVMGVTNTATEIGVYHITATVEDKNFATATLEANLTITAVVSERSLLWSGSTLYFQNAIDDDRFYAYTGSSPVRKVNSDSAIDMIPYGNNKIMYVSKSLLSSSIKTAAYDSSTSSFTIENAFTANARYVQTSVGSKIAYYVVNGLTNDRSGIYKVDWSGEEPVTTLLSVGKAKYLTLVGDTLYFADGANGDKLSSIPTSGTNQNRALVVDEKINNLMYKNGTFYYTVNNLLGDYIESFDGNVRRKLTTDAGTNLQLIDGYIYYVNVDKLSTSVLGSGIYKVNASPLVDYNAPGAKVIDGGEVGVSSLTSDGTYLYYYDCNGYKLNKANVNGAVIANLLDGFVKPEDPAPTSKGGDVEAYNGVIYYLDIWDGKKLHSYNPKTKANFTLTSNKVDNFSIIGDSIYANMVTNLVNNDTYVANLRDGSSFEKINKYDGKDYCSDGTYLYFIERNAGGFATAIRKSGLSGEEGPIIYDKGVSNLRLIGDKVAFEDGNNIHTIAKDGTGDAEVKVDGRSIHTTAFDTDGTHFYYRDMYSLAYASKRLARCNVDGSGDVKLVDDGKTDPIAIKYQDSKVYYCCDTLNVAQNGLFVASATSAGVGKQIVANESTYYAEAFAIAGEEAYFTNYSIGGLLGDSRLYVAPLDGSKKPSKVA